MSKKMSSKLFFPILCDLKKLREQMAVQLTRDSLLRNGLKVNQSGWAIMKKKYEDSNSLSSGRVTQVTPF